VKKSDKLVKGAMTSTYDSVRNSIQYEILTPIFRRGKFLTKTGMNLNRKKICWLKLSLTEWVSYFATLAACCVASVVSAPLANGQSSPSKQSKDEPVQQWATTDLPEQATKRFGQFNKRTDFNGFYALEYSPDGTLVAARDRKHRITILNVEHESIVSQFQLEFVNDLAFSADNQYLVTASDRHERSKIWQVSTGEVAFKSKVMATHCSFLPDGSKALLLDHSNLTEITVPEFVENKVTTWKTAANGRLREHPVAMTDDGASILSCQWSTGSSARLTLLSTETGERENKNDFGLMPKKVVVSKNGRWLGSMFQRKRELHLWDLRQTTNRHFVLMAPEDTFLSVDFSNDGRFVYTSDWKKNIIVWDLLTREKLLVLKGHGENVNGLASSPELLEFASGASGRTDASILFWDLKPLLFPFETLDESKKIERVWKELGSAFANKSISATAAIVNQEDLWIPELIKRCKVESNSANQEVEQLIEMLQDPKFKVRQWATAQLKQMTSQIVPLLEEALDSNSPEVRWRIKEILAGRRRTPRTNTAEMRRAHRAVLALELIGTEKAIAALEKFSTGHADFNVSEEAKEALVRLNN
jgi:WD40 repeat protein